MNLNKEQINKVKRKRKWENVQEKINVKLDLKNEHKTDENFIEDTKERRNVYEKKLNSKYDEFGNEFTAFNMREELEEGEFDKEGFFVGKKGEE
jgi:hypothetical protein